MTSQVYIIHVWGCREQMTAKGRSQAKLTLALAVKRDATCREQLQPLSYLSEDVDGFIGAARVYFSLTNIPSHNPLLFNLQVIETAILGLPLNDKPERFLQNSAPQSAIFTGRNCSKCSFFFVAANSARRTTIEHCRPLLLFR